MAITPALYPVQIAALQSYRQRVRAYVNADVLDLKASIRSRDNVRELLNFEIEIVTPTEILPIGFVLPNGEPLTTEGARVTFDIYAPADEISLLNEDGIWMLQVSDKVPPYDSALLMYGPASLNYAAI